MLVPTTILAQQHVADLPRPLPRRRRARRGRLALPRSGRGLKGVRRRLPRGQGRHPRSAPTACSRATSCRRDLGLVIVDEEQRFGVAQKELLRQLRTEVDVLALSATPIPRTLHMSLVGPARHLGDRHAAARPPADPHARRRVRRGARAHGAPPRARRAAASRSTCTTASSRSTRRPSSCASSCPRLRVARRPRADGASASSSR